MTEIIYKIIQIDVKHIKLNELIVHITDIRSQYIDTNNLIHIIVPTYTKVVSECNYFKIDSSKTNVKIHLQIYMNIGNMLIKNFPNFLEKYIKLLPINNNLIISIYPTKIDGDFYKIYKIMMLKQNIETLSDTELVVKLIEVSVNNVSTEDYLNALSKTCTNIDVNDELIEHTINIPIPLKNEKDSNIKYFKVPDFFKYKINVHLNIYVNIGNLAPNDLDKFITDYSNLLPKHSHIFSTIVPIRFGKSRIEYFLQNL
jgi:hypothetical protein